MVQEIESVNSDEKKKKFYWKTQINLRWIVFIQKQF